MCSPTRILHLIDRLDGFGRSGQLRMLVDAQRGKGHQTEVLALNASARVLDSWNADGIRCRQFDRRWQWDPFVAWRLSGFFRSCSYEFDLLHAWDHGHFGLRALRRTGNQDSYCGDPMESSSNFTATTRLLAAPCYHSGPAAVDHSDDCACDQCEPRADWGASRIFGQAIVAKRCIYHSCGRATRAREPDRRSDLVF